MWHRIFKDRKVIERHSRSWLGELTGEFLKELAEQRYRTGTVRAYAKVLHRLSVYGESRGTRQLERLPETIAGYVASLPADRRGDVSTRPALNRFLKFLRDRMLAPPPPGEDGAAFLGSAALADYVQVLEKERGVSPKSIAYIRGCCEAFLRFLEGAGVSDLGSIKPETIHDFILEQGSRYARKTMSGQCSALRGFLRHLVRRGSTSGDLSIFVVAPRLYRQEGCPRFLTRSQVQAVLAAVDRRTRVGLRDYAILLLLATYGLRGIELRRLQIEDIDWRQERLHIPQRKAGNTTVYPLAGFVGDATLRYLERGRPASPSRHLFLRTRAPYSGLTSTRTLDHLVCKYLRRAKITVERPGPHTFRYSCAQRLLDQGFPLKTIGDFLGHRSPDSTQRYTLIALDDLREVALGDGEELL